MRFLEPSAADDFFMDESGEFREQRLFSRIRKANLSASKLLVVLISRFWQVQCDSTAFLERCVSETKGVLHCNSFERVHQYEEAKKVKSVAPKKNHLRESLIALQEEVRVLKERLRVLETEHKTLEGRHLKLKDVHKILSDAHKRCSRIRSLPKATPGQVDETCVELISVPSKEHSKDQASTGWLPEAKSPQGIVRSAGANSATNLGLTKTLPNGYSSQAYLVSSQDGFRRNPADIPNARIAKFSVSARAAQSPKRSRSRVDNTVIE